MDITTPHFTDIFAYYFTPKNGAPTPAIFQYNPEKPGYAWLFLLGHNRQVPKVAQAIEMAQSDLSFAIKVAQSICELVPGAQTLRAALFQRGYDWPGYEKIEIEIPPELQQERLRAQS